MSDKERTVYAELTCDAKPSVCGERSESMSAIELV